ncbi:MAG TPA: hypothetical protein VEK11_18315 [Thermoanaerobaculia bacterium]|nr:hypothetical protein [Thermoanaerobaculia bacterium]
MRKAVMVLALVLVAGGAMADGVVGSVGGRSDDGGLVGSGGGMQSTSVAGGEPNAVAQFFAFLLSMLD